MVRTKTKNSYRVFIALVSTQVGRLAFVSYILLVPKVILFNFTTLTEEERERKQLLQSTCYLHEKKRAVRKYQLINGNLVKKQLKSRVVAQHLKNVPLKPSTTRGDSPQIKAKFNPSK
uniref:(northern house mosquito) hypothetical protein n=1 Tax=Culex pipiens TaxID=7175 RepID=A0A8D8CSJ7_CULPI